MKNVTLLERQLRNATSAKALTPVFLPDGKSCLFYGNQQLLTVDTVSELIAGLFLTVHNNSQISSILIAFPNGVFDEKFTYVLLECYIEHIIADHRRFFREGYGDDEFFMLSAFQDRISGRPNEYLIGGTGLPTLIKWLEVQADGNNCYVLSGRRKMQFIRSLLEYDEDHWIGMNHEHDFQHCAPDKHVFSTFPIYFPGTAYNLNFVMETENAL